MMRIIYAALILIAVSGMSFAQNGDTLFTAFWNMENLFDTADDSLKDDAEWLPDSEKGWTEELLDKKMSNMSALIKSMNWGNGPDILGMCEVENEGIVKRFRDEYLAGRRYGLIHDESPDNRGIDVSLIYDEEKFEYISSEGLAVKLADNYPTRNILHAVIAAANNDTLHLFVNHWPSRRGGEESELSRVIAAEVLRLKINEISRTNTMAKIIIMGDFNDEPNNRSILDALSAEPFICSENESAPADSEGRAALYNLSYQKFNEGEGTYKYRDDWNMLDQIIISSNLIENYVCGSFTVYKPDFIVTRSGNYAGTPFPTYGGRRYLGGYSDHFPVFIKLVL